MDFTSMMTQMFPGVQVIHPTVDPRAQKYFELECQPGHRHPIEKEAQARFLYDVQNLALTIIGTPRAINILSAILSQPAGSDVVEDGKADPPRFVWKEGFKADEKVTDLVKSLVRNAKVSLVSSACIGPMGKFKPEFPDEYFLNHKLVLAGAFAYEDGTTLRRLLVLHAAIVLTHQWANYLRYHVSKTLPSVPSVTPPSARASARCEVVESGGKKRRIGRDGEAFEAAMYCGEVLRVVPPKGHEYYDTPGGASHLVVSDLTSEKEREVEIDAGYVDAIVRDNDLYVFRYEVDDVDFRDMFPQVSKLNSYQQCLAGPSSLRTSLDPTLGGRPPITVRERDIGVRTGNDSL